MNIHVMVWDENGLSTGDIPLHPKTMSVTIVDGDREIMYDPESHQVFLSKINPDGTQRDVKDFDEDLVPVEA